MKNRLKYLLPIIALAFLFMVGCRSQQNESILILKDVFPMTYDRPKNPDSEQLSIIRYILAHTVENNIHKMRGEESNVTYINPDGREAVYDENGVLVTNSYNKGSFNYYDFETEPIKKFIFDTLPWLNWGNDPDDPTSIDERLYYYTLDLDSGIQRYIFYGSGDELEHISFSALSKEEQEVYYLFSFLLFSDEYKIKLNSENMERLIDDGEYYYEYFKQIQEVLRLDR
jgi:hypothetical protein